MEGLLGTLLIGTAASVIAGGLRHFFRADDGSSGGPPPASVPTHSEPKALVGVRGWLLVFALILLLQPMAAVWEIRTLWGYVSILHIVGDSSMHDRAGGLIVAGQARILGMAVLALWSLVAAVLIFTRSAMALPVTRGFLWASLASTFAGLILLVGYERPDGFWSEAQSVGIRGCTFFGIWYLYLSKSKRVAQTLAHPRGSASSAAPMAEPLVVST